MLACVDGIGMSGRYRRPPITTSHRHRSQMSRNHVAVRRPEDRPPAVPAPAPRPGSADGEAAPTTLASAGPVVATLAARGSEMTAEPLAPTESRPAILTVDDDPGVSRAVARDLRRRYGKTYRIVRAESGADALDALNEMKLRGDDVALLLADHRMPLMDGIQFLEKAMDIYRSARRVLLTAYADTDAAITAINVVDLDYYLLKPWDPAEEKLYPVIDDQLQAWHDSDHSEIKQNKLIFHRWSARSSEVRDFLARNQVPCVSYLCDEPEGERLLAATGLDSPQLPVMITVDGTTLVNPTDAELAEKVGLSTAPAEDFYDIVVIGAGPAGLGAAVYGASEGLRTVLVERTATGGQAGQSSRIENYLGFPDGVSGAQLT
jgi:thioredoxin reductase (NADPH)